MIFYYGLFLGLSFGAIIGYVLCACINVSSRSSRAEALRDITPEEYLKRCEKAAKQDRISVFPCL
jgi:hypothetical protein